MEQTLASNPADLKKQAKFSLSSVYGEAAAVILLRGCIAIPTVCMAVVLCIRGNRGVDIVLFSLIGTLQLVLMATLAGVLAVGSARYFLNVAALRDPQPVQVFSNMRDYRNMVEMYLLRAAFTLLWSLLLLVPGAVAAIRYAMASYIMAVNPGTRAAEALRLSGQMMRGNKRAYFRLLLSFAGWYLLCLLTAGIGFFFILSYIETAKAAFFNALSEETTAAVEIVEAATEDTR